MRTLALALILLLTSCNQVEKPVSVPTPATTSPEATAVAIPVSAPASPVVADMAVTAESHEASKPIGASYEVANVKKIFTVKIEATNYTAKQKEKLSRAEYLIGLVFNSVEYKQAVTGFLYKQKSQFDSSNGLSNLQVYEKLFEAAEALQPAKNYQMDLKVTMYTEKYSRVVGWTKPSLMVVNTNSKYHNVYSACQVASNLTHEWTHKMGFGHNSASSYYSVPYAHNSIIEKLCPLAENNKLTPL